MLRPCLDCGKLAIGSRCPEHTRAKANAVQRDKRSRRPRASSAETDRRAEAVRLHVMAVGEWCPGWGRDGHVAFDLTADHITPVGTGGSESGPLRVLCRSCNGRKQNRQR